MSLDSLAIIYSWVLAQLLINSVCVIMIGILRAGVLIPAIRRIKFSSIPVI